MDRRVERGVVHQISESLTLGDFACIRGFAGVVWGRSKEKGLGNCRPDSDGGADSVTRRFLRTARGPAGEKKKRQYHIKKTEPRVLGGPLTLQRQKGEAEQGHGYSARGGGQKNLGQKRYWLKNIPIIKGHRYQGGALKNEGEGCGGARKDFVCSTSDSCKGGVRASQGLGREGESTTKTAKGD